MHVGACALGCTKMGMRKRAALDLKMGEIPVSLAVLSYSIPESAVLTTLLLPFHLTVFPPAAWCLLKSLGMITPVVRPLRSIPVQVLPQPSGSS